MKKYATISTAMLVLSSFLGIVIGDNTWLQALQILGARKVIIVDSVKPFVGALLGSLVLGEKLSALSICGMFLTCAGVLVVALEEDVTDNSDSNSDADSDNQEEQILFNEHRSVEDDGIESISLEAEDLWTTFKGLLACPVVITGRALLGYTFALVNVVLDAYGSILTKQYGVTFSTWEINLIRFGFAAVVMGVVALAAISWQASSNVLRTLGPSIGDFEMMPATSDEDSGDQNSSASPGKGVGGGRSIDRGIWYLMPWRQTTPTGWALVSLGVCFVTYMCPALANYALFQMNVGLCLTLTSLGPLYSLPLVWFMKGERTSSLGILGTFVAFVGVVMLCYTEGNQVQTPEVLWEEDEVPTVNMTIPADSYL